MIIKLTDKSRLPCITPVKKILHKTEEKKVIVIIVLSVK